MKRTTTPKPKMTEGRKEVIKNIETYHRHLKGKIDSWPNSRLLCMVHPNDRDELELKLKN